jgi:hypothetical protein
MGVPPTDASTQFYLDVAEKAIERGGLFNRYDLSGFRDNT